MSLSLRECICVCCDFNRMVYYLLNYGIVFAERTKNNFFFIVFRTANKTKQRGIKKMEYFFFCIVYVFSSVTMIKITLTLWLEHEVYDKHLFMLIKICFLVYFSTFVDINGKKNMLKCTITYHDRILLNIRTILYMETERTIKLSIFCFCLCFHDNSTWLQIRWTILKCGLGILISIMNRCVGVEMVYWLENPFVEKKRQTKIPSLWSIDVNKKKKNRINYTKLHKINIIAATFP